MTQPADTYGLLALPATTTTDPAGDPLLGKLAELFKSAINASCLEMWKVAGVAPNADPVRTAFPHNPEDVSFNEKTLPALFVYRAGQVEAPADMCADLRLSTDEIALVWVFPLGSQEAQRNRAPIVNAVVKTVDRVCKRNRDASWIDSGDTDPTAAELGSDILDRCGLWELDLVKWSRAQVKVDIAGADTHKYAALDMRLRVKERWEPETLSLTDVTNTFSHADTDPDTLVLVEQLLEP